MLVNKIVVYRIPTRANAEPLVAGIPLYTLGEQVDGNGLPCTNKCWNDPNMQLSIVWQYVILNLHPFVLYYTSVVENTIKDFLWQDPVPSSRR